MVAISENLRNTSFKDILRVATDPHSACKTANRIINQPAERYNTEGTYIFEEDWDNLILLDSCRFDYFSELNTFEGTLESRVSRGSTSVEFVRGNFQGPNQLDTIYVSANTWYKKISEELGDNRSDVYLFDRLSSGGYEQLGEMRTWCKKVTDQAINRYKEYPNKRMIIHYMPPHKPYVDKNGDIIVGFEDEADTYFDLAHRSSGRSGCLTKEEMQKAYRSSVQYILKHIETIVDKLDGLTVISADHGEMLVERSHPIPIIETSHPEGVYVDQLVKVPWFKIQNGRRREIVEADTPHDTIDQSKQVTEELNSRLRDLGYKV
jgi:hypothetical protein